MISSNLWRAIALAIHRCSCKIASYRPDGADFYYADRDGVA